MAITVCGNCIGFGGSYTLCSTAPGFSFDGVIRAKCGFCDCRKSPVQGSISGYNSGGGFPSGLDTIDKFPFSADSPATDVGEITSNRGRNVAGQSSTVSGYTSGGFNPVLSPIIDDTIDKFPFSSDSPATDVGELTQGRYGTGSSSLVSGYTMGGTDTASSPVVTDTIDKFPFASDSPATDVGELQCCIRLTNAGHSSCTHGYVSGGSGSPDIGRIHKFPFTSDAPAIDVAELAVGMCDAAGTSSATHGYNAGGVCGGTLARCIQKFPFAADVPATNIGVGIQANCGQSGQSSINFGYSSGRRLACTFGTDTIEKYSFVADTDGADVGELTQGRTGAASQQV